MKELATAMAKAQAEIKAALKDSKNPHFKSSYADLTSVWDACRGALTKNGLSVLQVTDFDANDVWLVTMLLHSSGESVSSRYPLRPQQQTPQGYGSSLTYARRYCLASIVGVVADEDDDGNAASRRGERRDEDDQPAHDPAHDAAKAFVRKAIKEVGGATTAADLENWVTTWTKHIDKLREKFPDEAKQVDAGISAQRAHLTKKVAAE